MRNELTVSCHSASKRISDNTISRPLCHVAHIRVHDALKQTANYHCEDENSVSTIQNSAKKDKIIIIIIISPEESLKGICVNHDL